MCSSSDFDTLRENGFAFFKKLMVKEMKRRCFLFGGMKTLKSQLGGTSRDRMTFYLSYFSEATNHLSSIWLLN